mgnify:CR=1 FL=1
MEILSSGSFVNLENREKIEQLIYTAREIAGAAVETDGFVNETENNRRLALEIWQGAEYMTRDREEAQVRNIFVNNFLDRLREIGGAAKLPEIVSENAVGEVETPVAASEVEQQPQDEFLGLVAAGEIEENSARETFDSVDAQASEVTAPAVQESLAAEIEVVNDEAKAVEPAQESQTTVEVATESVETAEPKSEDVSKTNETSEIASSGGKPTANDSTRAKIPGAIVLSEKEPYRWEKCTVTATIQLLPMAEDSDTSTAAKRKAVLSVRTHDFAPQFSVVELGGANVLGELLPALEQSFERYKTDLPLKVMDKMKKEKPAAKKQSGKTIVSAKPNAAKDSAAASQPKPDKVATEKAVAEPGNDKSATVTTAAPKTAAAIVPAKESGQQGSLFNF